MIVASGSAELAREQAFFDTAAAHRDRRLAALGDAATAAAVQQSIGTSGTAVAFGRTDADAGERVYIGRHLVRDGEGEVLVVRRR